MSTVFWTVLGPGKFPAQKLENVPPVYTCGKRFTSVVSKMVEVRAG